MSAKSKNEVVKDAVQALVVIDNFNDDFLPITQDLPLALVPVLSVPLLDYTLEFLSLGGIEETFLFCTTHVEAIKDHVRKSVEAAVSWSVTMKVNILVSEGCRSFGDCLRDVDAKGLIRGDFILVDGGVISNIKLLPLLKQHKELVKKDKDAAVTLLLQDVGLGQVGHCPNENLLLVASPNNRVLHFQNLGHKYIRKLDLPLEILTDNPLINLHHNLKDTHVSICSASALPLFADNFDFQTKSDFIRGLLMNEEIMGSTIYWHQINNDQYGAAVTNWRMYQLISRDVLNRWTYPLVPDVIIPTNSNGFVHLSGNIYWGKNVHLAKGSILAEDVVIGRSSSIAENTTVTRSVIGSNVKIGKNVTISDSFILSNTIVGDDCAIDHSVLGQKCVIRSNCTIKGGSVLGKGVEVPKDSAIEDSLIQATVPEQYEKLGDKAYCIIQTKDGDSDSECNGALLQMSRLFLGVEHERTEDEFIESSDGEDDMSYRNSPVPDDTNMFLTEVIDSLKRGFEDKLQCDNLILEINSSRYAYNVTVREVNHNVAKAILILPLQSSVGASYLPSLRPYLIYFSPIFKNYIRNDDAMRDCLGAIEEVATSYSEVIGSVSSLLNWFYDKDLLSEELILNWFDNLDESSRLHANTKPFAAWLQQPAESSSDDE